MTRINIYSDAKLFNVASLDRAIKRANNQRDKRSPSDNLREFLLRGSGWHEPKTPKPPKLILEQLKEKYPHNSPYFNYELLTESLVNHIFQNWKIPNIEDARKLVTKHFGLPKPTIIKTELVDSFNHELLSELAILSIENAWELAEDDTGRIPLEAVA